MDRFRARRVQVALALAGILAAIAAVAVNVATADEWLPAAPILASGVAAAAGVGSVILSATAWRSSERSARAANELAATARIRSAVHTAIVERRRSNETTGIDVTVSVRSHNATSPEVIETASALIASLSDNPQCTVITGPAGSGKTTLLLRLADRLARNSEGEGQYVPIFIQCKTWRGGTDVSSWVISETRNMYGISSDVTRFWLNKGKSVLLLDGLDEVQGDLQDSFVTGLSRWLNSALGGRAMVSCRKDTYLRYSRVIPHEQVASLQPISAEAMERYVAGAVGRWLHNADKVEAAQLLRLLAEHSSLSGTDWRSPLLLQLLSDAVRGDVGLRQYPGPDRGAIAIKYGDDALRDGDTEAALRSYLVAADVASSPWRSRAGVRASLLLAKRGDLARAQQEFERSVASALGESLDAALKPIQEDLSPDERQVLEALESISSLDAFQISSRSELPPSACNIALRTLRERGLVDVLDSETATPRFRRSAVEFVQK